MTKAGKIFFKKKSYYLSVTYYYWFIPRLLGVRREVYISKIQKGFLKQFLVDHSKPT